MNGPESGADGGAATDAGGSARETEIREALRPHEGDGWIDCQDALAIAARLGVSPSQVGRLCDRAGIKIANCQLGCFGMRGKGA